VTWIAGGWVSVWSKRRRIGAPGEGAEQEVA